MLIVRQIRGAEFSLRVFSYGSRTIEYCQPCWFCDKPLLQMYLVFFLWNELSRSSCSAIWLTDHPPFTLCLEWRITTSLANGQDITGNPSVLHAQWPCWEGCTSSMRMSAATDIAGVTTPAWDFAQPWPLQAACTGFGRLYSGQEKPQ